MTWFAIFDWEHKKDVLMDNPKLYKIGLEDVYFNGWVFWRWWFYAIWQGTLLMLIVFYTIGVGEGPDGKNGTLMVAGNYIQGAVVIIVNVKLLINSYEYTFWYMMMFVISMGSWPLTYWGLSCIINYPLFGVF
jgi:magnesium-transporting ATPase (P-type)